MNLHVFGPLLDKSLLHWLNSDSLSPVKNILMNILKKRENMKKTLLMYEKFYYDFW